VMTIDPTGNAKELLVVVTLVGVQHIMFDHNMTFSNIIMKYIDKVKESTHNVHPSYVNSLLKMLE